MKLNTKHNQIETNITNNSGFTIKANSHSFAILSSGLYSDKVLAIVRELSTNAIDSHVAKGTTRPFDIKLPTLLDNTFYIKDYGIGLSPEQIMGGMVDGVYQNGLYTTYFESTKQDSNDFIGALGLGSKTPFNYTDTFFVISVYNNIESTYVCHLNEQFIPSVSLFSQIETEDENGLTIKFDVQSNDFSKFQYALDKVYPYLTIKPNVIAGNTPKNIQYSHGRNNWKLKSDTSASCKLIQGGVAYPLDNLNLHDRLGFKKIVLHTPIDIFVDIGDVEIAASREQLSYTKFTIDNLVSIISGVYDDVISYMDETIKNATNIKELYYVLNICKIDGFRSKLYYAATEKAKSFVANNPYITVMQQSQYLSLEFPNFKIKLYEKRYGSITDRDVNIQLLDNPMVIVNYHKHNITHIKHICANLPSKFFIVVTPITKDLSNLKYLEMFNPLIYTIPHKKEVKPKAKDIVYRVWNGHSDNWYPKYSTYSWKKVPSLNTYPSRVYVPIDGNKVKYNDLVIKNFDKFLNACANLKIHNSHVYGFNAKEIELLDDEWVNLFDLVTSKYQPDDSLAKYKFWEQWNKNNWFVFMYDQCKQLEVHDELKELKDFITDVEQYKDKKEIYTLFNEIYNYDVIYEVGRTSFSSIVKRIKNKYPMLKYITTNRYLLDNEKSTMLNHVLEYCGVKK